MNHKNLRGARALTHLNDDYLMRRVQEVVDGLGQLIDGAEGPRAAADLAAMKADFQGALESWGRWRREASCELLNSQYAASA